MARSRDDSNRNNYHQTVELHIDYGSEVLRRIIETHLGKSSFTLQEYLDIGSVKRKLEKLKNGKKQILFDPQWNLLYPGLNQEPELCTFDVSLSTLLLVETNFSLSRDELQKINDLRKERNKISHVAKAELPDRTRFNMASTLITDLSGTISQVFEKEMKQNIVDLQKRETVSFRSCLDIVDLRNEDLMVILIDRSQAHKVDPSDTTYLKYGLTKWAKQFSKHVDLETLLMQLKDEGVLTYTEKLQIEKEYNKEEQVGKLILKMTDETNDNLFRFCRCLRSINESLANLIENRSDDGRDIDAKLKTHEAAIIRSVLNEYIKDDRNGTVTSEKIHVLVEMELGFAVKYSIVEDILLQTFSIPNGQYSFQGIKLKDAGCARLAESVILRNAPDDLPEKNETLVDLSCEKLAAYVSRRCDELKPGIGVSIERALIDECIAPRFFMEMTKDKIKECILGYLQSAKVPMGIMNTLEVIQREIRVEVSPLEGTNMVQHVRKFDSPPSNFVYKKGNIKPFDGNLLIPAHEYRTLPGNGELVIPYIVKETIRFIAACMNSRKNGTIHFGIQKLGNGYGAIIGLDRLSETTEPAIQVQLKLKQAIETCFQKGQVHVVKRCIRHFQIVPIEGGSSFVLELDVIPYSRFTKIGFFQVYFPPKGKQEKKLFVYNDEQPCEIVPVGLEKQENLTQLYDGIIQNRKNQEQTAMKHTENTNSLTCDLVSVLTAGSNYVTEQFTPIICCGNATGCDNESNIRQGFHVPEAFLSSVAVFDFDSSVKLRNQVEKDETAFQVVTADDSHTEDTLRCNSGRIWMYCNGNSELNISAMNVADWYKHRFNNIKNAITICGQNTPRQRAVVIFFVFCTPSLKDPVLELAEDCIKSNFRDQCVIIAESNDVVDGLKNKLSGIMTAHDLEKYFYIGFKWTEIANTLRTIFPTTTQYDYKLPCSNGHFIIMTTEEKRQLNFSDIDILSGEECKQCEINEDDDARRTRKNTEQENYYKGRDVTWWNFYYGGQVEERDLNPKLLQAAKSKLSDESEHVIERLQIRHQPGAGGSTAGKYLLWQLSQFDRQGVKNAYRCCVIKQVTEETANQIYRFLSFKDDAPKPIVILTDNENEEHLRLMLSKLNKLAYSYSQPGKLFCLLIEVNRVSVSYSSRNERILTHKLSIAERSRFETKYHFLEQKKTNVETLISFNVMRKSFDEKYIKQLAAEIVSGVKDTEFKVLKCLALISTFDRDDSIPVSTFDCLVSQDNSMQGGYNLGLFTKNVPIGLTVPPSRSHPNTNMHRIWNQNITDELTLLIKKVPGNVSSVMIISQAMAKAILDYIITKENITLWDIVTFVLSIVEQHVKERNQSSKHFVKVVNSLFKTRVRVSSNLETKSKFSEMILELQKRQGNESEKDVNRKVVGLMERCFKMTLDAFVGQQLARFFISMKEFDKAEDTIKASLELKPKSSYLYSTYGQVCKTKMEYIVKQTFSPIFDDDAIQIIEAAFSAIQKYVSGQRFAKSANEMEDVENTCLYMEVKTTLSLLENFKKFACYVDQNNLLCFLNKPDFNVSTSSFKALAAKCEIEKLRKGSDTQTHIEQSLRRLEERKYQIKRFVYMTDTYLDNMQLKNLREEFETFYGNNQGISQVKGCYLKGLKSLMQAHADNRQRLSTLVAEAKNNLQSLDDSERLDDAETNDLFLVLGYELIQMSNSESNTKNMDIDKFKGLLRYSEILLQRERSSSRAYLEAFLYFAILNWPSESRSEQMTFLCKPKKYMNILEEWKKHFDKNFDRKNKGKNYFALGKGSIGCDIVDLDAIRNKWKAEKKRIDNRKRKPVFADNFWREPFVVDRLARLAGRTDANGTSIKYEIKYLYWKYSIQIRTYQPCTLLSNRRVTFVLGFTWEGLAAFDVAEKDKAYFQRGLSTPTNDTVLKGHNIESGRTAVSRKEKTDLDGIAKRNASDESVEAAGTSTLTDSLDMQEGVVRDDRSYTEKTDLDVIVKRNAGDDSGEAAGTSTLTDSLEKQNDVVTDDRGDSYTAEENVYPKTVKEDTVGFDDGVPGAVGGDVSSSDNGGFLKAEDNANPNTFKETTDGFEDGVPGAVGGVLSSSECTQGSVLKEEPKRLSATTNPLQLLNDRRKDIQYIQDTQTIAGNKQEIIMWANVDGQVLEGRGRSKQQAKREVARKILKELYDISCEPEPEPEITSSTLVRPKGTGKKKPKKNKK